jgi:predicted TIM-barrel fold metal-dependent hydrolase
MPDYPIIDAHVHTFPRPEIGWQAQSGAGLSGHAGTVEELVSLMREGNISHAVMVNMTPVFEMKEAALNKQPPDLPPHKLLAVEAEIVREVLGRLQRRNAWTCEVARENPGLVAFISLDPIMGEEALVAEVEERAREGAKGIKLHPANQRFFPNDRRLWPAYARAQELGMSIITHSGALALLDDPEHHDHPHNFRDVLRDFPRMNLVFAHMCRGFWDEVAEVMQAFPNAYLDTSGAISGIPNPFAISDEEAMTMIRRVGPDRVLFASDWPWHHPIKDSARVDRLPLTAEEKRLMFCENAQRVLALKA